MNGSPAPTGLAVAAPGLYAWQRPALIAFFLAWIAQMLKVGLRAEGLVSWAWTEPLFWVAAAAASLTAMGRRLPAQNVMTSAAIICALASVLELAGARTSIPFGPRSYTNQLGAHLTGDIPWTMPLLWLALLVNARGVARLIMRPWRKTTYYGFWVLGLSVALVGSFSLFLEPAANGPKHYWIWAEGGNALRSQAAPWIACLGGSASTLLVLAFATPWLINKQPIKLPPDYQPLLLWTLIHAWLAISLLSAAQWYSGIGCVSVTGLTAFKSIRGARW